MPFVYLYIYTGTYILSHILYPQEIHPTSPHVSLPRPLLCCGPDMGWVVWCQTLMVLNKAKLHQARQKYE